MSIAEAQPIRHLVHCLARRCGKRCCARTRAETLSRRASFTLSNHGQRVVTRQRLLQSASDIFLGWSKMHHTGNDFHVRQLRDMKGAFNFASFDIEDLAEYAVSCGTALAQSMAKAGDPALISGYVGKSSAFDQAIARFALSYAERNEADWAVLKSAVKAGTVQATHSSARDRTTRRKVSASACKGETFQRRNA